MVPEYLIKRREKKTTLKYTRETIIVADVFEKKKLYYFTHDNTYKLFGNNFSIRSRCIFFVFHYNLFYQIAIRHCIFFITGMLQQFIHF